jgi:exodeoxyribonuclease V beta subunit
VPAGYSARIAALGFAPLRGHLRGFIDLVFEHDGRFYVVDYKSNYLGPQPTDYTAERLSACMAEHHYYLQYYLYTVALHRHLARRLVDYSYERHFGGVYYLFVRALSPEHAEPFGIFYDEPQRELIEMLSDKLARGVAA